MRSNQSVQTRQSGLSMIELMISMTLGLIITAAVMQVFISSNQTYRMQHALARLQENGWAAIHFISRDLRMAGFWGCLPNRDQLSSSLLTLNNPEYKYESTSIFSGSSNSGLNRSDSITVLRVKDQNHLLLSAMSSPSDNLQLNSTEQIKNGDKLLITDCFQGDLFQVTDIVGNNIKHERSGNRSESFDHLYQAGSQLYEVYPISYQLRRSNGVPTLYRKAGSGRFEALIENIEQIQILYGENTDSKDGTERYVELTEVSDPDRIQSIRVALLVRSDSDNLTSAPQPYYFDNFDGNSSNNQHTAPDRRLRQAFATTITVRNHIQ